MAVYNLEYYEATHAGKTAAQRASQPTRPVVESTQYTCHHISENYWLECKYRGGEKLRVPGCGYCSGEALGRPCNNPKSGSIRCIPTGPLPVLNNARRQGYLVCEECGYRESSSQFIHDLIYLVCPKGTPGVWQRNVCQLVARLPKFDGVRSVAVFQGSGLESVEAVQSLFAGHRIDNWIVLPNDKVLKDRQSFHPLMETLSSDPSRITFYGHTKGITRDLGTPCHRWTEMMYETLLDYLPLVHYYLQSYGIVGTFKKLGFGFQGSRSDWHFSGTFFWFNNQRVFSQNWRELDSSYSAVESWPSLMFSADQAKELLTVRPLNALNLYSQSRFVEIENSYAYWRQLHQGYRG